MFKIFSLYTDTLSESFRDACTYCLTKQRTIVNVYESVFDEKLKFFTHTLHLSNSPQEIIYDLRSRDNSDMSKDGYNEIIVRTASLLSNIEFHVTSASTCIYTTL
jgi:chloramphenicol O-acetyltransferase